MCMTVRRAMVRSEGKGVAFLRSEMGKLKVVNPAIKQCQVKKERLSGLDSLIVSPLKKGDKTTGSENKLILFFHGGGYVFGSPESYLGLLADLSVASNCQVISPDYSLAPEATYPRPQDECVDFALVIRQQNLATKLILAGDSAGGALAISTAMSLAEQAVDVQALILLSPWVDPTADGGSIVANEAYDFLLKPFLDVGFQGLMKGQSAEGSKACFKEANLSGLPKTFVQYGTAELFKDQIESFVERAKQQGVDIDSCTYADQCHDFQFFTAVSKTARQAVLDLGAFIKKT